MTDYFKKTLLQWVTGDYNIQNKPDGLVYSTTKEITNNLQTTLTNEFPNGYLINLKFQPVNTSNQGIGYTILCGIENTTNKGFIVILDTNFNVLAILTEYTSGVKFGNFLAMNIDEKGQYFAIENQSNNVRRLVLLNNITSSTNGEYKVSIRTAYNLQTDQSNGMLIKGIVKAENTGKYLLYGTYNTKVTATEFTINVGAENEWVDYASSNTTTNVLDLWANWDDQNNLKFKIAGYTQINGDYKYAVYSNEDTGTNIQENLYGNIALQNNLYSQNAKIINENEIYFAYNNAGTQTSLLNIYYLNIETYQLKRIYFNDPIQFSQNGIELFRIGTEVFFHIYYLDESISQEISHYIGRVYDTSNVSTNYLGSFGSTYNVSNPFMVTKQFNLYNYYQQYENTCYSQYQIFNENNYNGEPYNGTRPLNPVSGRLYHNNIVVFARNLYNVVVNGNTTTSTLEVPNTFVNEIEITPKELWGGSNQTLVSDTDSITTNIYETLLINYINTINMSNQNNPNNIIINNTGASGLNLGLRYSVSQTRIEVLRINYEDGTKLENTLNPVKIDDTHYNYTFPIFVSKTIKNIQFMTNYEKALGDVYLELDGSVYEVGKAYTISQNVRVE